MKYVKECTTEKGAKFVYGVETSSAHAVLEKLGFVSEIEMDRRQRRSEGIERMKASLCPGCSKSFALCSCELPKREPGPARLASGKAFFAYKTNEGKILVKKYFGPSHMKKTQDRPFVVAVAGPCITEQEAAGRLA